eukprot:3129800-Amphidinium_carterae.1
MYSWSRLQSVRALSSRESEYYQLTTAGAEAVFLQSVLTFVGEECQMMTHNVRNPFVQFCTMRLLLRYLYNADVAQCNIGSSDSSTNVPCTMDKRTREACVKDLICSICSKGSVLWQLTRSRGPVSALFLTIAL